jgi:hypothetical protein
MKGSHSTSEAPALILHPQRTPSNTPHIPCSRPSSGPDKQCQKVNMRCCMTRTT